MLDTALLKLERLVESLLNKNNQLTTQNNELEQQINQLNEALQQAKDDNETLQLELLEFEEKQNQAGAKLNDLVNKLETAE